MADNAVMDKAGDILGKKYGPLPFGAWLGIIAVTAFVARRLVKGNAEAKQVTADEGYVVNSNGQAFPSAYKGTGGGVPFGSGTVTSASSTQGTVTPITEVDNNGWLKRAAEKLRNANMWNPLDVQSALTKYVTGQGLTNREQAIVNQAITMEGEPPVNVYGGENDNSWGVSAMRVIQPAGNAGLFIEYSDGSVKWIQDGNEWRSLVESDPEKFGKINVLPITDPIWRNSDVYQAKSQQYLDAEAASRRAGNPSAPSSRTIYTIGA